MLGPRSSDQLRTAEAKMHVVHAVRHFPAASDVAGLTLTLYDLSSIAVAGG